MEIQELQEDEDQISEAPLPENPTNLLKEDKTEKKTSLKN
jgi:hypothetical protein